MLGCYTYKRTENKQRTPLKGPASMVRTANSVSPTGSFPGNEQVVEQLRNREVPAYPKRPGSQAMTASKPNQVTGSSRQLDHAHRLIEAFYAIA